jgi:hypothetical protein
MGVKLYKINMNQLTLFYGWVVSHDQFLAFQRKPVREESDDHGCMDVFEDFDSEITSLRDFDISMYPVEAVQNQLTLRPLRSYGHDLSNPNENHDWCVLIAVRLFDTGRTNHRRMVFQCPGELDSHIDHFNAFATSFRNEQTESFDCTTFTQTPSLFLVMNALL